MGPPKDLSGQLRDCLPASVAINAVQGEVDAALFPPERDYIAGAVPSRRREFTTGRACARAALADLGVPSQAIGASDSREPQWPPGIVGSITHSDDLRAAAAGSSHQWRALGIDAETYAPLPEDIVHLVTTAQERENLVELAAVQSDFHWETLIFSAKESVFKAWFPRTGQWLDFTDCDLSIEPQACRFQARLTVPGHREDRLAIESATGGWKLIHTTDPSRSWLFTYLFVVRRD